MIKTIENKIRLNITGIYIIAVIICFAMILFFYYSRNNINQQKTNIELHDQVMTNIKTIVNDIDQAQQDVNSFIATKHISYLNHFHDQLLHIENRIDSLKLITDDSLHINLFKELEILLKRKGSIISELSSLFDEQQSFPSRMQENLIAYERAIKSDVIEVETFIVEDTIVKSEAKKKSFWKKLASAFSSKQETDTIMTVSKEVIDSIKITNQDPQLASSKRDNLIARVQSDYSRHISNIEESVILLIVSDHEISSNISNLLIQLYDNLLDLRVNEIKENEQWLRKNNTISIIIALIALLLILLFIILIITDVNKGLSMRKSLEIANLRTQQLMESRHQLLLSVSHDIKTPLNSILGYLELNNDSKDLSTSDLSAMRNSGKYILSLLENLLEFSALELGTLTANKSNICLYNLCQEIKEMFIPLALKKGLHFNFLYEFDDQLHIISDSLKLKQIIINILSNSIKYTSTGKIEFIVRYQNEELYMQFIDTGVGIPSDQLHFIYKPFIRVDENKNIADGTGFGMYVVHGLVTLLNGTIDVQSNVNKGTTITIKLPVSLTDQEDRKVTSSLTILVIDDDPAFSTVLTKMLNKMGHTVNTKNSYSSFLHSLSDLSTFDLVMTDMEMGDISGIDILKKIRSINPSIPVYIITGRSDFNNDLALSLGFNGFLPKPVTGNELLNITYHLSEREILLKPLKDMFDNDEKAIEEIITLFIKTSTGNLNHLKSCIEKNNYSEAQAICHKMLPMFIQIELFVLAEYLKKMDERRDSSEKDFPLWKNEGMLFISETKKMLDKMSHYFPKS